MEGLFNWRKKRTKIASKPVKISFTSSRDAALQNMSDEDIALATGASLIEQGRYTPKVNRKTAQEALIQIQGLQFDSNGSPIWDTEALKWQK